MLERKVKIVTRLMTKSVGSTIAVTASVSLAKSGQSGMGCLRKAKRRRILGLGAVVIGLSFSLDSACPNWRNPPPAHSAYHFPALGLCRSPERVLRVVAILLPWGDGGERRLSGRPTLGPIPSPYSPRWSPD